MVKNETKDIVEGRKDEKMFEAEYVRNCNCNYERIALQEKPQEKKYQYCILSRGGIHSLLPCSLRYINSDAFLYYDITSTQNMGQLFSEKTIDRGWMKDFLWGIRRMRQELDRFLLEEQNIIWHPEHIFQDLEKNDFYFLYIPYYGEDTGLDILMDYLVEKVDYSDEALVEFLYSAYEQLRVIGLEYLDGQMYDDFLQMEEQQQKTPKPEPKQESEPVRDVREQEYVLNVEESVTVRKKETAKKGVRFFKDRRRRISQKEDCRNRMRESMKDIPLPAVCEDSEYGHETIDMQQTMEEEFGKTIYIEEAVEQRGHGLYRMDGELVAQLDKSPFVIGKKKENSDLVLTDYSASRVHARIVCEDDVYYLEDLNSTNGTYKNGLRMQPYEKRKLECGDELKFAKTEYIYR